MNENKQQDTMPTQPQAEKVNRPNESGQLHISGFLKISDPETKEVILETRA